MTRHAFTALVAGRWLKIYGDDVADVQARLVARGITPAHIEPAPPPALARAPVTELRPIASIFDMLEPLSDEASQVDEETREQARIDALLQETAETLRRPYSGFTLASYRKLPGFDHRAAQRCSDWLEARGICLYLCGETGTGKTGLAAATLKEWAARHGWPGRFIVVADWLAAVRAGFGTNDAARLFDEAAHAACLVLDDLGAEKPTEWAVEQLFRLVNERSMRRPTIVTSNYSLPDLQARFAVAADPILGERIVFRLIEQCYPRWAVTVRGRNQRDVLTQQPLAR